MNTANTICFNDSFPGIANSDNWFERGSRVIPGATQTLAKGPTQHIQGIAPKYLQRGEGAYVWDVDGNQYIDFNMGIGPLILGYAYPRTNEAITRQLRDGITFSLMHPLEVEVAEKMIEMVPNAELVRFGKTGAEATSAAIRVSRAYTGRKKILCCGYHGWHDWYIAVTSRRVGVPPEIGSMTKPIVYNDIESLEHSLDTDTACVILEPTIFEAPAEGYLDAVKRLCEKNGTLLIFDEMWTGFRLSPGGAQQYFNVTPDLATFSKAMANGMPISAITGRKEIMKMFERDVFFYSTFGGEALSLAAALATMNQISENRVLPHIHRLGKKLRDGYNQLVQDLGIAWSRCIGFDCRSLICFDNAMANPLEIKSLMQQEMIRRGILWSGIHNLSYSHKEEDIDYTLAAYTDLLPEIQTWVESGNPEKHLRGKPVEPVFRVLIHSDMKPAGEYIRS